MDQYYSRVCADIAFVGVGEFGASLNAARKLALLKQLAHSHGSTALLLSGGASLGMYHLGVAKALFDNGLLPRVITGSSAGAIVGALLCSRTDDKLPALFDAKNLNFDVFEKIGSAR